MAWQASTSRRREEVATEVSGAVQKQARMATGGHDHLLASQLRSASSPLLAGLQQLPWNR